MYAIRNEIRTLSDISAYAPLLEKKVFFPTFFCFFSPFFRALFSCKTYLKRKRYEFTTSFFDTVTSLLHCKQHYEDTIFLSLLAYLKGTNFQKMVRENSKKLHLAETNFSRFALFWTNFLGIFEKF